MKPVVDYSFAILLIPLLGGIGLLVTLIFISTCNFPVFFKQQRTGKNGKHFWLWKFRTLTNNQQLPLLSRQFLLGTWLRRLNLDELPQVINILKGEMSWVGPRPLPTEYDDRMSAEQKRRWQVKPGITGWAQVNGRHSIGWQTKFELDSWYVQNISFITDLKIIIKTIFILLSLKEDKSLLEKEFRGE